MGIFMGIGGPDPRFIEILAREMAAVCRGQFTPRTDIRFVPDGRGNLILQGRLVQ